MTRRLTIAGLGPAGLDLLPPKTRQALESAPRLILRTARHPAATELRQAGCAFQSLDEEYESAATFETLYRRLADRVLAAADEGDVAYAVPGHPLMGEESVRLLLEAARRSGIAVTVLPAPGFVDAVGAALATAGEIPELREWQVVDACTLDRVWWETGRPALIYQLDDGAAASRVKLALAEEYPDGFEVWLVRHAGEPGGEEVRRLPLFELDRPESGDFDHLCTLYVPPLSREHRRARFDDFVEVIARLRGPGGCPWDREQTHASLKRYLLEECYEALEAIDQDDPDRLCDELGDVMLQVLLHAQIADEAGVYDIRDVIDRIVEKLIRRHPHVFADVRVSGSEDVTRNWEAIKQAERPDRQSVLDGVPRDLPALMKALEVSKRVARVGFEWARLDDVFAKLDEELGELKAELPGRDPARLEAEIGDLLFTVVNIARWLKIDPEEALRRMLVRFDTRFRSVERQSEALGRPLAGMGIKDLDQLWENAKEAY